MKWIFGDDELQHSVCQHGMVDSDFDELQHYLIDALSLSPGQYLQTAARYIDLLQILENRLWITTNPRFEIFGKRFFFQNPNL